MLQLDALALAKIENTIQKLKVYRSSIKNIQKNSQSSPPPLRERNVQVPAYGQVTIRGLFSKQPPYGRLPICGQVLMQLDQQKGLRVVVLQLLTTPLLLTTTYY
jgi:hypothetical protein